MKKLIILTVMSLALATNAQAELFNLAVKPVPSATVLGQKVTWPLPSLVLGSRAGEGVDTRLSTRGFSLKVPFFSVRVPFPHLTVGVGKVKVSVGAHGVKKARVEKAKKKSKK